MMKQYTLFQIFMFMLFLPGMFISCTDDWGENQQSPVVDDSNLVETRLSFEVAAMNTSSSVTRAADDTDDLRGTAAERKIDNIWVFQFDATTQKLLITPRYYDISDKNASSDDTAETAGVEVDVLLKPNIASIVYVVANTGSSTWAGNYQNFATLNAVKEQTLPAPNYKAVGIGEEPTDLSLPMEGGTESVTPTKGTVIEVQVTRMYAKVEVLVEDIPETIVLTDVNISQIPYYCRVGTLASSNSTEAATYPSGTSWNSRAFSPGTKNSDGRYTGKIVLYLPENLQGCTENGEANPELKTENAQPNALRVDFVANYVDIFTGEEKERGRHYAVYPGANNYNDYNIKRNFIYRVRLNIYTDQYNQDIPSSNCFVVKPGQTLSFLPYYRTESGGGYKFTDYLDANGNDDTKKINDSETMSENIKIIWQTKDAIGDNTAGDRVWIDRRSEASDEYHRKIHVKTDKRGNALIAAYNSSNKIVWSWHIWVTENEPANVSNAIVYSTYAWNERQILTDVRVPGYAIMSCNLGALKYYPEGEDKLDPETHGMLYQWGRKDPFPPATNSGADKVDYTDNYTGKHYDNDNKTVVGKTAGTNTKELFHSLDGTNNTAKTFADAIQYTIQNPTVFICGTYLANQSEDYVRDRNDDHYFNGGDWLPNGLHDNKLWGGLDPDEKSDMKFHTYTYKNVVCHIFDNYGDQKSIFDPCPSGWRVPPGDLWLGFTDDGYNPDKYSEINTATQGEKNGAGMYMYMTDWQKGLTSFFPTQGTRVPDGKILRTGSCGNYHNATTDENDRVNILHIHRNAGLFRIFETTYYMYYVKSTGGPVRCVRDHK